MNGIQHWQIEHMEQQARLVKAILTRIIKEQDAEALDDLLNAARKQWLQTGTIVHSTN